MGTDKTSGAPVYRQAAIVRRFARTRLARDARDQNRGAFLGDAAEGGWEASVSTRVRFEDADDDTARLLGVPVGAEVCVRDRVMSADGEPVQLAVSTFPRDLTRGTAIEDVDTGPGGVYARLEEAGQVLIRFEESIATRMPTAGEQSKLRLAPGTPVLVVPRVAHAESGPVEVNRMTLAGNRYELHYAWPAE